MNEPRGIASHPTVRTILKSSAASAMIDGVCRKERTGRNAIHTSLDTRRQWERKDEGGTVLGATRRRRR